MKLPPTDTGACGERRGYQRHYRRNETACAACLKAWSTDPASHAKPHELAAEIEHLLDLNQGWHYILKALGYTRNPHSLERLLQRSGHHETATRLFHGHNAKHLGAAA